MDTQEQQEIHNEAMLKAGCGKAEPLTGDGSGVHCAHSSDAEIGSASSQASVQAWGWHRSLNNM